MKLPFTDNQRLQLMDCIKTPTHAGTFAPDHTHNGSGTPTIQTAQIMVLLRWSLWALWLRPWKRPWKTKGQVHENSMPSPSIISLGHVQTGNMGPLQVCPFLRLVSYHFSFAYIPLFLAVQFVFLQARHDSITSVCINYMQLTNALQT